MYYCIYGIRRPLGEVSTNYVHTMHNQSHCIITLGLENVCSGRFVSDLPHMHVDDLWFSDIQQFLENINKPTEFLLLPWLRGGICNEILYCIYLLQKLHQADLADSYCYTSDIDFSNGPSTGPCGTPAVPNCQRVSTVAICWANDWHPSTGEPI